MKIKNQYVTVNTSGLKYVSVERYRCIILERNRNGVMSSRRGRPVAILYAKRTDSNCRRYVYTGATRSGRKTYRSGSVSGKKSVPADRTPPPPSTAESRRYARESHERSCVLITAITFAQKVIVCCRSYR